VRSPRLHRASELFTYTKPSVVALHGLGGGNESTWSCGTVNWLRDQNMLQHELPHARIMTYGYNANVALNTNQADLRDQAVMFLNRLLHKRDNVR
jgi:predicted alpha/beta-fold hydrolase